VKGDISSTVAFKNFDAALGKQLGRGDDVCGFGIAAESYNGRVLEQQQRVPNAALFAEHNQLFLQAKPGCVIDSSELEN
jgi:hypothetical protein